MKKQIFKIKKIKNSFYLFSVFIFIIACSDKQIKFMQTKSEVRSVTTNRNNPSNFQGRGRGRGRGRDRDRRTKYKNFNEYLNADSSSDDSGNFGLNNGFEGYIKQNKKFQKEPNINHNEDEDLDCLDFENYIKQNKKFQKEPNINHNEDEDLDCLDERFGNNHIGIYKFNIILNNDLQHKYENKKIKKASEDDKINSESKSEEKEGINSESKSEEKEEIKCLICKKFLGPYIRILKCGHKIHRDCVNNWINTKSVCSLCKAKPKKETTYTFEIDGNERIVLPLGYKNIGPLYTFGVDNISPEREYKHLKDEILNNKYAPLTEKTWKGICKKCEKVLKGGFISKRKNVWSKKLRDNNIRTRHLVALKLYTDYDHLQKEFRKSFRKTYNKEGKRSQSFYWWRKALIESYEKLNIMFMNIPYPINLFHGVNQIMGIEQYDNIYYGPFSTTSNLNVARTFAGKRGMILQIKPEAFVPSAIYKDMNKIYCPKDINLIKGWLKNDKNYINIISKTFDLENKINTIIACYYHKTPGVLDVSWISDYPDEIEYLMFNASIELRTWILSSDYDQHYHYYRALFKKNLKKLKAPSGHLSYENQIKVLPRLKKLKACIEKVNIKNFSPLKKGYKDKKEVCDLNPKYEIISEKEMIGILFWLYDFAYNYKIGKKKLSKYDQSLNLNIQHIFKRVHEIYISKSQVVKLMNNFRILYWQVLGLLNMYFINSKVFLKDYENDNQYRFLTGYKNRFWYKFDPYRKMLFYYIMNKLNNNPKEGYGEFTPLLVTFKDAKFTKDELNSFKENPIMYNWSESKVLYDIFRNNSWEDNIHLENWFFNKS